MEESNIFELVNNLNAKDWKKLFDLIPQIESCEEFIQSGGFVEDKTKPIGFMITPIIESKVVLDFEEIMYELNLVIPFNWGKWDYGRKIVRKGDYSGLKTITLLKILTAIIRNNRFCDGALAASFEDKTIVKILKQLQKNIKMQSNK